MTPKFTVLRRMCTLLPAIGLLTGMAVACDDDDLVVDVVPTPVVRTIRNPAFDFATLRTFAMPDTVAHFNTTGSTSSDLTRAFDRVVFQQLRANLTARGYVEVLNPQTTQPDFVVLIGVMSNIQTAYQTYSFNPTTAITAGGEDAPGFTNDWTIVYPFYSSANVITFDRGTFLVTFVPTATLNAPARKLDAEWAGSATSLLVEGANESLVRASVDEMFVQSPYLVAGP